MTTTSVPDSRYRITERVAAGGMAEVFRGVAESIQGFRKNVAIKRVLPALTKNKKFVAMFLDEARLSLHLQHANIVQVFDIGHADETYFIVMEFVEGIDLKRLLEWRRRINRPLTIGQTVYIIMEAAKGLACAHEAAHPETGRPLGIVHRDVSPPNLLLSRNGEIKLTDFGLAKAAVQVETTDPGVVKGKMSYLSPEAARGEEVDRRADIFAVGILLYEMLTGKRLFYGLLHPELPGSSHCSPGSTTPLPQLQLTVTRISAVSLSGWFLPSVPKSSAYSHLSMILQVPSRGAL
jgi:serine/threonine-protein kinase